MHLEYDATDLHFHLTGKGSFLVSEDSIIEQLLGSLLDTEALIYRLLDCHLNCRMKLFLPAVLTFTPQSVHSLWVFLTS